MIAVSACLCGINCRYDADNCKNEKIVELFNKSEVLPICPELLGGLKTPREPHEIIGGTGRDVLNGKAKIVSRSGIDNTKKFVDGANKTLHLLQKLGINKVILKSKSPSCGYGKIYDGTFSGKLIDGNGILAELLLANGIQIEIE